MSECQNNYHYINSKYAFNELHAIWTTLLTNGKCYKEGILFANFPAEFGIFNQNSRSFHCIVVCLTFLFGLFLHCTTTNSNAIFDWLYGVTSYQINTIIHIL